MRIATFLPHVGVYGGVRRFIELGNAWQRLGHEVTLYHPAGTAPGWLPYTGRVATLEAAAGERSELAFCADRHTFDAFRAHASDRHVYYCVIEKDPAATLAARSGVALAGNSGPLRRRLARRHRVPVLDGVGGIDLGTFRPDPSKRSGDRLRVLLNGRRSRPKKGTDLVLRALAGLVRRLPLEIVLFDHVAPGERDPREGAPALPGMRWVLNPDQETLASLYQSTDVFVAAERKAGWCNTALEAMACGAAVACTRSGTTDFAVHGDTALVIPIRHPLFIGRAVRRLVEDAALRERLAAAGPRAAEPWSWDRLAAKLLEECARV